MSKKLITACLAVAAFAAFVVLPASASASPRLCETTANLECHNVAVGTKLTGTNVGDTVLTTSTGVAILDCSKALFTGELTTNSGTHIVGDINTATFTGTGAQDPNAVANMPECTGTNNLPNATVTSNGTDPVGTKIDEEDVANGSPYCITAASDTVTIRGGTCTEEARKIVFLLDVTGVGVCEYSRTPALSGTLQTDTEAGKDATVTLASSESTEFEKKSGGVLCPSKGRLQMTITLETHKTTAEPLYVK